MALSEAEFFYTKIRILARICTIVDKLMCEFADMQMCRLL